MDAKKDYNGTTVTVFRGTYGNPRIYKTQFNAFTFLPTPPPQEPKKRVAPAAAGGVPDKKPEKKKEEKKDEVIVAPPPKQKQEEEEEDPIENLPLLVAPPEDVEIHFCVLDREKNFRSYVTKEGECFNNRGQCIGYLNFEASEAGSVSEMFLGRVAEHKFDNLYQVYDHEDDLIGYVDMGTGTIRNGAGATVADIGATGIVSHTTGTYLGEFECRHMKTYHHLKEIALYLVLLDPGMLNNVSG